MTNTNEDKAIAEAQVAQEEAAEFLALMEETLGTDVDLAREVAVEAKKKRDQIEAQRKYLKAPALEQGRRIDGFFQPPIKLWDSVIRLAKKVIAEDIARQRAEQAKALAAAKTLDEVTAAAKPVVVPEGVSERKMLRIRVTDWRKVPEELLELNTAIAIGKVRAGSDISEWGEVYYESTTVVR
jgi:hypothetical protein